MYRLLFAAGALLASLPAWAQVSDSPYRQGADAAAYYYFVAANGTITESFIMPCHNPSGDLSRPRAAEYWYNKNTGFRGTLLWEWWPHPTNPLASHWTLSYGPTIYDEDTIVQWCFTDFVPEVVLRNSVPETVSASQGDWRYFRLELPNQTPLLRFTISGPGDADLYVRYGARPDEAAFDCRPWVWGSVESCEFPNAGPGTYYVGLQAYEDFSNVSVTAFFDEFLNGTDFAINDYSTVNSPITVSGFAGNAPAALSVSVDIVHTYQGELKVDLVAPDGTLYNIHNRTGGGTDNIIKTVTVNASSEGKNGVWKLRVNDNGGGDVGTLRAWKLKF